MNSLLSNEILFYLSNKMNNERFFEIFIIMFPATFIGAYNTVD